MPEPAVRFRGEVEPMVANAARPLSTAAWVGRAGQVLEGLAERGPMTPGEVGRRLGMSEDAVASILSTRAECASAWWKRGGSHEPQGHISLLLFVLFAAMCAGRATVTASPLEVGHFRPRCGGCSTESRCNDPKNLVSSSGMALAPRTVEEGGDGSAGAGRDQRVSTPATRPER